MKFQGIINAEPGELSAQNRERVIAARAAGAGTIDLKMNGPKETSPLLVINSHTIRTIHWKSPRHE